MSLYKYLLCQFPLIYLELKFLDILSNKKNNIKIEILKTIFFIFSFFIEHLNVHVSHILSLTDFPTNWTLISNSF